MCIVQDNNTTSQIDQTSILQIIVPKGQLGSIIKGLNKRSRRNISSIIALMKSLLHEKVLFAIVQLKNK
jgi:hypothetical protein